VESGLRQLAADELFEAERARQPIRPLAERYPLVDLEDAYEIQLINIRRRVSSGAHVKGHKVGLSSRTMQRMMEVHEPDYGHLLSDMFAFECSEIDTSTLIAPRVEVEIAFILGQTLPGVGCTVADVMRCTDFVCPSLEIIDSRVENWQIGLIDTIADNASSGLVVLGGNRTSLKDIDPRKIGALLRRDGEIIAAGSSGAVLGNPATAVAWLAGKVHEFGVTLEAGHVVLPGSCTRAYDVFPGQTIQAEFDKLGEVTACFR
jgi:2-keto-4-pentenoate hydratase